MRTSAGEFQCCIYGSAPMRATLVTGGSISPGVQVAESSENEIRGWRSLYYGQKDPALSLAVRRHGPLPIRFVTVLAPSTTRVIKVDETAVEVEMETGRHQFTLGPVGSPRVFFHQT
jgi:hypothetical protein